jgi:hypothetical protein
MGARDHDGLVLLVAILALATPVAGNTFIDRLTNGSVLPSTLLYLQIGAVFIAFWLLILAHFVVGRLPCWHTTVNSIRGRLNCPFLLLVDTHDLDKMEDSVELQIEVLESADKVAIRR